MNVDAPVKAPSTPDEAEASKAVPRTFGEEFRHFWNQLPNKGFFLVLFVAWLGLFQWVGNSVFGYLDTHSLLYAMYKAYSVTTGASDDSYGLLIPPVVLVLFWWKRNELLAQPLRIWAPGMALVVLALLLHMVGYAVQQPRISIIALFAGIYGLMGLAWGSGWLRKCLFPYFLLVFCVPLGTLTEPVTFPLRLMVSKMVALIGQNCFGIDVVSDGTRLLKMPWGYEYEVAAACSGIHSLLAIAVMAIIYAFVAFPERWKRALLIFSAIPLAVIGNTVRMLLIILAAEWHGQKAGNAVHENWFWSMIPYVPAILGLVLLGRWLERKHSKPTDATPSINQPLTFP